MFLSLVRSRGLGGANMLVRSRGGGVEDKGKTRVEGKGTTRARDRRERSKNAQRRSMFRPMFYVCEVAVRQRQEDAVRQKALSTRRPSVSRLAEAAGLGVLTCLFGRVLVRLWE